MTDKDGRDFREFYDVYDALAVGVNSLRDHFTARGAASSAMKGKTINRGYSVQRIQSRYDITFGRVPPIKVSHKRETNPVKSLYQHLMISPSSEDVLLLSAGEDTPFKPGQPLLALRYGIYAKEFVIAYAQTPSEVTLDDYITVKNDFSVRPHEFLFAQFIARVAPILDKYPMTGVYVASHYLDKPVYPTLRDRFFDTHYILNPNRKRVQEILGEDNAWLEERSIGLRTKRDNTVRGARKIKSGFGLSHALWPELIF